MFALRPDTVAHCRVTQPVFVPGCPVTPPGPVVVGPVVVVSGEWLRLTLTAVMVAERALRLRGSADTDAHRVLAAALKSALSACPATDIPAPAGAQTDSQRWLSTEEVAEMLDCTPRSARRLAPLLDGQKSGRWFIPERAVLEHIEGRSA